MDIKKSARFAGMSFLILGSIYILNFFLPPEIIFVFVLVGIALIVAWRFMWRFTLKQKMVGVYIGWAFILVGLVTVLSSPLILLRVWPLIILIYFAYINYKVYKDLKASSLK